MAKKHFDEYYNKVSSQLQALNKAFNELSQEVAKGMVEPERIEQMKLTIKPVQESWQTLCYMKYLLDKPKRKSKHNAYDRRSNNLLSNSKGKQAKDIIDRNQAILKELNSL